MSRNADLPFPRGTSWYGSQTIDTNAYGGSAPIEGKEYDKEDLYSGTGQMVTLRVVRNSSGINLLPKRAVSFMSGQYFGQRVDGYARLTNQQAVFVDEALPSTGVKPNELFYVVIRGPAKVKTGLGGDATNVIAAGDVLVALTAAASTGTTAGRVATMNAASTNPPSTVLGRLGIAMSAATTANTDGDLLVYVTPWL